MQHLEKLNNEKVILKKIQKVEILKSLFNKEKRGVLGNRNGCVPMGKTFFQLRKNGHESRIYIRMPIVCR